MNNHCLKWLYASDSTASWVYLFMLASLIVAVFALSCHFTFFTGLAILI